MQTRIDLKWNRFTNHHRIIGKDKVNLFSYSHALLIFYIVTLFFLFASFFHIIGFNYFTLIASLLNDSWKYRINSAKSRFVPERRDRFHLNSFSNRRCVIKHSKLDSGNKNFTWYFFTIHPPFTPYPNTTYPHSHVFPHFPFLLCFITFTISLQASQL